MASITLENSFQSTSKDMGENHIKAHTKQHKYLQANEPLVETLTNNKQEDDSVQLALKYAQEKAGLLTQKSWFKYTCYKRINLS